MVTQGVVLRKLERFEEALQVLREGIAIREKVHGPMHPSIGSLNYVIAQVMLKKGDYAQSQAYAKRALDVRLAAFGPEHPEVGDAYDLVGVTSAMVSKHAEALESFLKGMEIKEKALGKDHLYVSNSAVGAGLAYIELKQPERALPLFERALAINTEEPSVRGDAYFGIAVALDAQKRKEVEVVDAARKAREAFASVKDTGRTAEVDAWLAKRAKPQGKVRSAKHP